MPTTKRAFTLRLSEETVFNKVKKIAELNKRSTAMQIEYILEQFIRDYERINGEVK